MHTHIHIHTHTHNPNPNPNPGTIKDYAYMTVYEPAGNGAYFLGELNKFVQV